jgi:hypothetical protein
MKTFIITSLLLLNTIGAAWSQIEITLQSAYDMPIDELKWIYKPAMNNMLTFSWTDKTKRSRTAFGITAGYAVFQPKEDIFYYLVNEEEVGTITYEKYQTLQFSAQLRQDFRLTKTFEIFCGAELGYQYTSYAYISSDPYIYEDATTILGRYFAAPRLGVNLMVTEKFGFSVFSRYAVSIGNSDTEEDTVNHNIAAGAGLILRFE